MSRRLLISILGAWIAVASPATAICPGDCDENGSVSIAELIRGVNIALGNASVDTCSAFDRNGNGVVAINELIAAVNANLGGCPIEPIFPADYRDTYTLVRDCRLSIEHGGVMIQVWANDIGAQAYLDEDNPLPVGSVVVKDEYEGTDCETEADFGRWRAMRKEEPGFDPDDGDWAWQWVNADRSVLLNDKATCIGCHRDEECLARDYMCTESGEPTPTPVPRVGDLDIALEGLPGALLSISGRSATDVIAVGADPGDDMGPLVLRWNGTSWRRLDSGASGDLWWVSVTPIDGTFYMSGAGGLILRFDPDSETFTPEDTPTDGVIYGIWGTAANDLWAVGDSLGASADAGIVLRNDGTGWSEVEVSDLHEGGVPALFKVWGRSSNEVYTVGATGVILRWDGAAWASVPSGTTRNLFTVHGNADLVAAVGGFLSGVVVERTDGDFVDVTPAGFVQMNGVFVPEQEPAVTAGISRATAARSGGTWTPVDADDDLTRDYHATWVDPDGGVWAVGGDLAAGSLDDGVVAYGGPQSVGGTIDSP